MKAYFGLLMRDNASSVTERLILLITIPGI